MSNQIAVTKITIDLKTGEQERRNMTLDPATWKKICSNPPLEANVRYELRKVNENAPAIELSAGNGNPAKKEVKTLVSDDLGNTGVKAKYTKDCGNGKSANALIDSLKTAEEIKESIEGEERKGVLSYAESKIEIIIDKANA